MLNKPTPVWFSRLDRLPPYHEVRVPEEIAEEVLVEIFTKWHDPGTVTEMHERWNEIRRSQCRIRQDLAEKDWTKESAHQLVENIAAYAAIAASIATCLPEPYKSVFPPETSRFVFDNLLMAHGESLSEEHPNDPLTSQSLLDNQPAFLRDLPLTDRKWLLLKRTIYYREAFPHVLKEICRLAQAHLGSPVGALLLAHALEPDGLPDIPTSESINAALDSLRASTFNMADRRLEKVFKRPNHFEDRLPQGERKQTLSEALSGAIWKTVAERWGALEALDALARALDGEMNLVAQAVVDDLMNEVQHIFPAAAASYMSNVKIGDGNKRRRTFVNETTLDEGKDVKEDDSEGGNRSIKIRIREVTKETRKQSKVNQEEQEQRILVQQLHGHIPIFLANYPKHTDGIDLYLYDGPLNQEQLAKERGCTVQALHYRMNKAAEQFRKYIKSKD